MALEGLFQPARAPANSDGRTPHIPDYELLRKIGGGGYGDVWLGRSATGALRAVKVVWRATFENERPFHREFEGIQSFERLSREHPSQLALFHVGRNEEAGYFYYVMELADDLGEQGGSIPAESSYEPHTLRAELQKGRLPAQKVLELGLALTEALAHLHAHGLVHRDVKPSNIIFVGGRPKLADIGLVTDTSDARSIVGTEGYLAPDGPGTPQADLFALGKVLYEAATGMDRRKFPQLPPDLRSWPDAALVFELNEIFLKAGAEDAKQRYRSAEQARADLLLLQSGKSAKRYHAIERRLALATRAGVLLGIVSIVAAAVLFETNRQRKRATASAVRLQVSNGTRLMNEGDYFGALRAFAEALRLDAGSAKREEPHRIRIASLLQQCPKLVGVFPHENNINGIAFSPDGLSVVTSGDDQRAKVWDVRSGALRLELKDRGPVYSASYSPDGRVIMTASSRVRFWDAVTGHELPINTIKNIGQWVPPQPSFAPNGKLVATLVEETKAQLWDSATGDPVGPPLQHRARLSKFVFSPNSAFIATFGEDRVARVWNTVTGERFEFKHRDEINDVIFSPDSRYLLTASENFVRFWDLISGKVEQPSLRHVDWVGGISFSPQGDRLVAMCYDKTAQVWDLATRAPIGHPLRQEIGMQSARFTPDGRRIVTTGGTRMRMWDAETMELIPPVLSDSQWRDPAFISPDGRLFGTFSGHEARLWNVATVEPAPIPVRAISLFKPTDTSSNHRFRAIIGGDNVVRLIQSESSKPWTQPITEAAAIRQAYFLTNSEVLVTERDDTKTRLWHVASGQPLTPLLKSRYVWKQFAEFNPELPHDSRPAVELTRLAELLSRMRVDAMGGFQPLQAAESAALWDEFKRKYPGDFTASQSEALAWEDQQGTAAAQAWDWWAAEFHLGALAAANPGNESVKKRLAYASDALEHARTKAKSHEGQLHEIPPRDPSCGPEHLDLSAFFNKSIKYSDPSIPTGVQSLGGVSFDIRGIVQLAGMGSKNAGDTYPDQAKGIRVARKCRHLHFLQASEWETFVNTHIGSYIIHYAEHEPEELKIIFGKDVLNYWTSGNEALRTSRSQLVWVGSGPAVQNDGKSLRMFKTTWKNRYPDDVIEHIDFVSTMSDAAPFVVAITAD